MYIKNDKMRVERTDGIVINALVQIKRKTNPLPNINKKTPRENDAFNINDKNPRKKKNAKERLRSNRKLKTTSVAWLNL